MITVKQHSSEKTGTTKWYRSPEVWWVLSPLLATVLAMLITIMVLHGSGALQLHENLGKPLGKVHTGAAMDQDEQ